MDYDRFCRDDPIGEICLPLCDVDMMRGETLYKTLQPCKGHTVSTAVSNIYRSVKSVGITTFEVVVVQLVISKRIPVLLCGLAVFAFSKSRITSLDFIVNLFFIKLFNANSKTYRHRNDV